MSNAEYINWQIYWVHEPWGPWRDNLHAAMICREIRRPQLKARAKNEIEDFMVVNPVTRQKDRKNRLFGMLEALAGPRPKRVN